MHTHHINICFAFFCTLLDICFVYLFKMEQKLAIFSKFKKKVEEEKKKFTEHSEHDNSSPKKVIYLFSILMTTTVVATRVREKDSDHNVTNVSLKTIDVNFATTRANSKKRNCKILAIQKTKQNYK